jgi:tetratricopeptide (TPR) repeat protein
VADLESAVGGRGGAVVLIGEPGIGKTALAAELARRATSLGARVLWGRCSDLAARTEWESVAQALGALLDDGLLDAALAARCGGGLLAVLPDAAHLAPDLSPPAGADPETIAFTAARAISRLLRHVCLGQPCVLVIDDVHDADAASLRLLSRLAQEARTMKLWIVMTAREAELGARERVAEVAALTRDVTMTRLGALDREAGNELIRRVAPALPASTVERVLREAEGNPLFIGELAALLASRSSDDVQIPVGIKASIRSRLDRLPPETRGFVDALAVLGGHAPIERAAAIARVPQAAATLAFELGIAVHAGVSHARMSHALVRDVAYAELEHSHRNALHRRAAEDAAARVASGDHTAAIQHVRHLVASSEHVQAIDAAIVAARSASLRAADDEAVSLLETAGADLTGVDDRHRIELDIELGRALLRSGRSDDGVAACARAATMADKLGDPDLAARAALARGSVFRFGHVDRGLVAALAHSLAIRGPREDAIHARLLARHAAAEQPSLRPSEPIARAHEAFKLARRVGDDHVRLDVLHDGMAALVDFEDPRVRAELNGELLALARKTRAPWYELRALSRLVFDHADVGAASEADAVIDDLDHVARSFAHPRHQWRVAMMRAFRASSAGQWSTADRNLDEGIALGGDDPALTYALFGHRLARLRAQERAEELVQLVEESSSLRALHGMESMHHTVLAFAYVRTGQLDRARAEMPRALPCLQFEDVGFSAMYAEAAAALGDLEACAAVLPLLEKWGPRFASGGPMFMYVADPVERYLGLVVAALGDRARAIACLESALARLHASGSLPYIARPSIELATLLDSDSAPTARARAASLRKEAASIAERFDLVDLRVPAATETRTPYVPESPGFTLVREGEAWAITSRGSTFRLRDGRGLRILAQLVERPGEDLHALDLADTNEGTIDRGDAGVVLDARARAEYRARLVDIREDLADAERRQDLGWIDRLRTEAETIQMELARAFSPAGRARRSGMAAERARSAVTRRAREAIAKIAEHDPALGEHLSWAVRTGMTCSYRPNRS